MKKNRNKFFVTLKRNSVNRSVEWEKTGTRTSVSARKRKLNMQAAGRWTTTTVNVNTNVKHSLYV